MTIKINFIQMKIIVFSIVLIFAVIQFSCFDNNKMPILTGDIIFTSPNFSNKDSDFSNAINDVTKTELQTNYTHVGIAEIINDSIWIFHSTPEKGVVRELLDIFLEDVETAHVYRLKDNHEIIPDIIDNAKKYVGQKYDYAFLLNNITQYCSGYIFNIARKYNIFELEPMTFKNQDTNEFDDFWINYYNDLDIDIPEGEPGCNPNGMAKSDKIVFIKELVLK
jgi:hypothetical protein